MKDGLHPQAPLTMKTRLSAPDAIETGQLHACCLREDNLYVAEWVARDRMVRTCRRCHAKHHTARMEPGLIDLGLNRTNWVKGDPRGRRQISMGLSPGRAGTRR
jgi:hypothetical protein